MDDLPRNAIGKVQKPELVRLVEQRGTSRLPRTRKAHEAPRSSHPRVRRVQRAGRRRELADRGGALDTTDTSVVALHIVSASGTQNDALCSGTIVSPHVVLTAAHCLAEAVVGPIDHVDVFLGDNPFDPVQGADPSLFVQAASYAFDPSFSANTATHDIGYVVVAQPLAPAPMALNHDSLGSGDVGTQVQAVGFGQSSGTDVSSAGPRRTADASIFGSTTSTSASRASSARATRAARASSRRTARRVVAGVHSFTTTQTCNADGDDTRVDKYTSFVDDAIDKADPGYLSGGCNASGGSVRRIFAIAIALAALARRKKSG